MNQIHSASHFFHSSRFTLTEALYHRLNAPLPAFRTALILVLAMIVPASANAGQQFTVASPSVWIQPIIYSNDTAKTPGRTDSGHEISYPLFDDQFRVSGSGVERFHHHVSKIRSSSGLEKASQLELDFEPSFQKLIIHYIRIRRGDQTIDALNLREIKVIQKETELNQRLYNGTLSAIIFVRDVRVGDAIEFAYSINGENPILGGRFADVLTLCSYDPIDHLRYRLLWPEGRKLNLKNQKTDLQPVVQPSGLETAYIWERNNIPALEVEDNTPEWYDPVPSVELSEFVSWGEVAKWAVPLYQLKTPLSPELKKQIEKWRSEQRTPEARVLTALRFVQDEVRYLGIELGPHSHQPHDPSSVFAKRFGDCKDKALLLSTLLNNLDIEAAPALVNTRAKRLLDERQPSPYSFDHVIVKAKVNGQVCWVDATASLQRGGLAQLYTPEYERALLIREDTRELARIPVTPADQPTTVVKEVFRAESDDAAATLEVITTWRRDDADVMRYRLAKTSLDEISKDYLNFYAKTDPAIVAEGKPQVQDDPQANVIIVTEKYRIPDFWRDPQRYFYPESVYSSLEKPKTLKRTQPLRIPYPLHISHTTEIHLPPGFSLDEDSGTASSDVMKLDYRTEFKGNLLTLHYTLRTMKDYVTVEQIAGHLKTLDKLEKAASYRLTPNRSAANTEESGLGLAVIGIFALLFSPLLIFGLWRFVRAGKQRGRRSEFQSQQVFAPGSVPATAIRIPANIEFTRYFVNYRCACGHPFYQPGESLREESALFDGNRLSIVQLNCARCGHHQSLYFARDQASPDSQSPGYGQA